MTVVLAVDLFGEFVSRLWQFLSSQGSHELIRRHIVVGWVVPVEVGSVGFSVSYLPVR